MRAHQQRETARLALPIADTSEATPRRGEQGRRSTRVPVPPPDRRQSHERLPGPYIVALGIEDRERAFEPGDGRVVLSQAMLCQRGERLGLGSLVGQLERTALSTRAASLGESRAVGSHAEEDLGSIEGGERRERGIVPLLCVFPDVLQSLECRFVAMLQ